MRKGEFLLPFYLIALFLRFGDNQELEFNVQIKYQLPRCTLKNCLIIINTTLPCSSCTQSYQNNCPLIAYNLNQKMEASGHTAIVSKVI